MVFLVFSSQELIWQTFFEHIFPRSADPSRQARFIAFKTTSSELFPLPVSRRGSCVTLKQIGQAIAIAPQSIDDVGVQAIDFFNIAKFLRAPDDHFSRLEPTAIEQEK